MAATPLGKAAANATAVLDKAQAKASQKLKAAQGESPQAFADMLNRWGLPQPTLPTVPAPATTAHPTAATTPASAVTATTGATHPAAAVAATAPTALTATAPTSPSAANAVTTPALSNVPATSATTANGGQPATATPADSPANPSLDAGPLWGLQTLIASGPLQTPVATTEFATKAARIETALSRLAPTATPDQLNGWKTALTKMGQQLDQAELAATGIDPQSPPAGWTEPANFAAARSLLNTLQTTVAQAQGLPAPVLQAAAATTAAAGALTPRFAPIQPQGKATSKLFGATAAATGGGKLQADTQSQQVATTQAAAPTASVKPVKAEPPAQTASANQQASAADDAPAGSTLQTGAEPAAPTVTTRPAASAAKTAPTATVQASANPAAPQAEAAPAQASSSPAAQTLASAAATIAATPTQASASDPTKASPAAVAYLSSAIVKQANGKSTSFDIELHPADLGRVDVKLQIQADGRLAARLAFDNPAAAAQFEARSDDLRRSLEQAGFQVSNNSLSFTNSDQQASGGGSTAWNNTSGQGSGQGGGSSASNLQTQAADASGPSGSAPSNRRAVGLDMRI